MDNDGLVRYLVAEGYLKSRGITAAFRKVKREFFVREDYKKHAYADDPLPIGLGQTISAPSMVAVMTELLEPKEKDKVLEIGCGSGYQAAILGKLCREVYSIELEPELAAFAKRNLNKAGCVNVEVINSNGRVGYAEKAPYYKIIMSCSSESIPLALTDQLKAGGRLVAPIGSTFYQEVFLVQKTRSGLGVTKHGGCVFVPLR